jgi:hypothetical protein
LLATLDAVVAAKFYLSLIQSMLHELLFFSVAPVLVVVATKYYSLSYGQLLAEWLGGCRQNFSLEFQLMQSVHLANDRISTAIAAHNNHHFNLQVFHASLI